jgi:hypothetical protein
MLAVMRTAITDWSMAGPGLLALACGGTASDPDADESIAKSHDTIHACYERVTDPDVELTYNPAPGGVNYAASTGPTSSYPHDNCYYGGYTVEIGVCRLPRMASVPRCRSWIGPSPEPSARIRASTSVSGSSG